MYLVSSKVKMAMLRILIFAMFFTLLPIDSFKALAVNTHSSPIMITELVPDSNNVTGSDGKSADGYEFIELYNTSNKPLSMDNYELIYCKDSSSEVVWSLDQSGIVIPAGSSLVIWPRSASIKNLTSEDFNANYSTSLILGETLATTTGAMPNSGARSMKLKTKTGYDLVSASYTASSANCGINFLYDGSTYEEPALESSAVPSPGIVGDNQKPENAYAFIDTSDLQVTTDAPLEIVSGEAFDLSVTPQSSSLIHCVTIYTKYDSQTEYTASNIKQSEGAYTFALDSTALSGHTSLMYYVTVNDGAYEKTTEIQTLTIRPESEGGDDTAIAATTPIMITELVPDTTNYGSSDGYEYIELYNTSNMALNMDNYQVIYYSGTAETFWPLDQSGIMLPAGQTLVIWIKPTSTASLGASEFNAFYNTSLTLGENLATIQKSGMANSGERYIKLKTKTDIDLAVARYSATGNIAADKGISYAYNDSSIEETLLNYKDATSPGVVADNQKPKKAYAFAGTSDLEVSLDAPSELAATDSFTLGIAAHSSSLIHSVTVFAKYDSETQFTAANVVQADDSFTYTLSNTSLSGHTSLSYYVVVSDGAYTKTTETATVAIASDGAEDTGMPELVVTEILPDSSNVNGVDAYEFIEVYNNSNKAIDFKDYKLFYDYSNKVGDSKGLMWTSTPDSVMIPAGKAVVFWIKTGTNNALTASDFNTKFGTDLTAGETLIDIYAGGLANSGDRAIRLTTNVQDELDYVLYNQSGADDTTADKSITYRYSASTGHSVMTANDAAPTPGTVTAAEAPAGKAIIPADPAGPTLTDSTAASFSGSDDLVFTLTAEPGTESIKTVKLYIKDQTMADYEPYYLLRTNGDIFEKTLTAVDLTAKAYYDYYFEVGDGTNTVSTEVSRSVCSRPEKEAVRLNLNNRQTVNAAQSIVASSEAGNLSLHVDGADVTPQTSKSVEPSVLFVADISQTDTFFKNAVAIGDNVIGVFTEGMYNYWGSISYEIPASYFVQGQPLTISVHAGNKAYTMVHNEENEDDFVIKNIRLILQDGRTLRANGLEDPEKTIEMGDSAAKDRILNATFNIPDSSYQGIRYTLDTATLSDGYHTVKALSGGASKEITIQVDNTAPVITTNMEAKSYKGSTQIQAEATDAISGVTSLVATLDGKEISLPYTLSSTSLAAGEHTLLLAATDVSGNKAEKAVTFTIPEENPLLSDLSPDDRSVVAVPPVFSVRVNDPTNDSLTVSFKKGESHQLGDSGVAASYGVSTLGGATAQTSSQGLGDMDEKNGYPYQQFDVTLDASTGESAIVQVNWEGTANPRSKLLMYVYNFTDGVWDKVADGYTQSDGTIALTGGITAANHHSGSTVKVMVQNGLGYTPVQYAAGMPANATSNTNITTSNSGDLSRDSYDFTLAVESDTQYYNENYNNVYRHQLNIHDWLVANTPRMNIQYLFHTGDIVDDMPETYEWLNADEAYKILDDAKLPYGVLAGNHDVMSYTEGELADYARFSQYFGQSRYSAQPWYGESYQDNRGHYDLISVDGIDFIMAYLGWEITQDGIDWLNTVLQQYPERKAILNFHEYLLVSGGIGEELQKVYNQVVAVNPNVCMVLSGHYHNAALRTDKFDDNGDGVSERTVYSMLFDYQKLSEGGLGYMRLMHFDLDSGTLHVRTYSPSLDDYDAGGDMAGKEDFTLAFSALGITPVNKKLSTGELHINVYSGDVVGRQENVASGEVASYTWADAPSGTVGWYAEVSDEYGGLTRSDVRYLTVNPGAGPIAQAGSVSRGSDSAATVKFTPTQGGRYYYAVVEDGAPAPAIDTSADGTACDAAEQTITLSDLTAGAKDIYIIIKNAEGIVGAAVKIDIPAYSGGGDTGSGRKTGTGTLPSVDTSSSGNTTTTSKTIDGSADSAGKVTAVLDSKTASALTDGAKAAEKAGKKAIVKVKLTLGAAAVSAEVSIPGGSFSTLAADTNADLTIDAGIGSVTFDAAAVDAISAAAGSGNLKVSVAKADAAALSEQTRAQLGNRPVYMFTLTAGDTRLSGFGGGSAYISVPYTLKAGEDPHAVIVYYVSDAGALQTVRGKYNAGTGMVEFKTKHFSAYAVGYNKVAFSDVGTASWYHDAVTFIAARGITTGTGAGVFSPDATLTRGQFIVMLMRAYDLSPDVNPADNFSDAGNAYYTGYLAAAKRLGISTGVGGNLFAPDSEITRQEMFTLLYRALETLGELPKETEGKAMTDFKDAGETAGYAQNAITALVKSGIISGNNGALDPSRVSTRAEMAQLLYNLLSA